MPNYSGVCIAGFGTDEILPSLFDCKVDGMLSGEVKIIDRTYEDMDRTASGGIVRGYAQTDVMDSFMSGMDRVTIWPYITNYVSNIMKKMAEEVINHTKFDTDQSLGLTTIYQMLLCASDEARWPKT